MGLHVLSCPIAQTSLAAGECSYVEPVPQRRAQGRGPAGPRGSRPRRPSPRGLAASAGGRPQMRMKLGVPGAGCWGFQALVAAEVPRARCAQGVPSRALSLRPRRRSPALFHPSCPLAPRLPRRSPASPRHPGPAFCRSGGQGPGLGASCVRAGSARWPPGLLWGAGWGPGPGSGRGAARAPAPRGYRHPETDSAAASAPAGRLGGGERAGAC